MKEYTQSDTTTGNCWQTCVACVLEVDPSSLPCQVTHDGPGHKMSGWGAYQNILNGYLGKHWGLNYTEIPDYAFGALQVKDPGYHMLVGPTVRTEAHKAAGRFHVNHMVVARYGEMVWDPHPSRAGLTVVERWAVLAPLPQRVLEDRLERGKKLRDEGRGDAEDFWKIFIDCMCPACEASL